MLNVVVVGDVKLNVIVLSDVMLDVVAPILTDGKVNIHPLKMQLLVLMTKIICLSCVRRNNYDDAFIRRCMEIGESHRLHELNTYGAASNIKANLGRVL
jgi:hypothetical protein